MNNITPCSGCTRRQLGCHGYCEEYKSWQEDHIARLRYVRKNKYCDRIPLTVKRETVYRKRGVL